MRRFMWTIKLFNPERRPVIYDARATLIPTLNKEQVLDNDSSSHAQDSHSINIVRKHDITCHSCYRGMIQDCRRDRYIHNIPGQ